MKEMMNRIKQVMLIIVSGIMLMACLNSCKQEHITYTTTSTVNIYDYLKQNPDKFSLFQAIVDKAGYASFLNTYGTYTIFVPTNDGVNAYLKANNKANVDAIDAATAKGLVSIALIADTISTQFFSDGKLRTPTTAGQYLITSTVTTGNVSNTVINKQANLVTANIIVGNGIIHTIDNVLTPAPFTLAATISGNTKYSIFTAILKATGFYDTLNVAPANNPNITRKYLTVIGETDSTFKAAGFADYNAVKARYSTTGDPTNHADSLWLFAGYHIWAELSYISDIAVVTNHFTLAPNEVSSSVLIGNTTYINHDLFNGIQEPGQVLYRPASDISATNGVLHNVLTNYTIKVRFPSPVYYDVAAQPEIIKTPGLYKVLGHGTAQFNQGTIAAINTPGSAGNYVTYNVDANPPKLYYFNNDFLEIGLRWRIGNNGSVSVEFVTPPIVKGTYKIWADYMRSQSQTTPAYFDGNALPNTFNPGDALNPAETDAQAEARGYKSYSDAPVGTSPTSGYSGHVGRLLGIVTMTTTGVHKVKFVATAPSSAANHFYLDVIEFRPVTMDQVHPRLGHNGNLVP